MMDGPWRQEAALGHAAVHVKEASAARGSAGALCVQAGRPIRPNKTVPKNWYLRG